jgi:nucleotide-binding universal stress UspA family protein
MRVYLATDGSAGAQDAARLLTVLPGLRQITVMTVVRPVEARDAALYAASRQQPARVMKAELTKARQAAGRRAIELTIAALQASGAKLNTLIATGHPAEVIGRSARREKSDLLVLGSRGLTGKTAIAMGSVSLAAAQQTPCPILIVKPAS